METGHLSSNTLRRNVVVLSLEGRRLSALHQIVRHHGARSRVLTSVEGLCVK